MNIKNRIGKTPLIRAKELEKMLGISKIFLKLEGNNPSGHKIDRLSIMLLKDALAVKKDTICLSGHTELAKSIASVSQFYDIECAFIFRKNSKLINSKSFNKENIKKIEYDTTKKQDCIEYSKKISKEKGWYNANQGFENGMVNMTALSTIVDEINQQLKEPISTVFTQTSLGYGISGLHLGFRKLWMEDKIKNIPNLYSCTTDYGNIIYEEYKKNNLEIDKEHLENEPVSKYNRMVMTSETRMLKSVLDAIYDTGGRVTGVRDEELEKYVSEIKKLEKIKMTIHNGYSIAGFMKEAESGNLINGNHVIILNDGRISLEIEEITDIDIAPNKIVDLLDTWLMEYTDPKEEILDAVQHAMKTGHILAAYQNNDIKGLTVIVNLGFENFIPKYHLGYIATKKGGKGIATQLLNKAIEITDGNLSLHVDRDNKRAIKVYEKMGFNQSYIRMIHK
ncbi:pyridoxal-phosphate dependent enzyme [Oceanirhabdus seepicola]|uniref:Pyridoxal-phosphate dependent enzyme n=1 Tax=Oceanirhabdus seepicola TaxID=2828781 RepID=A0A9J6P3U1_9CLOT|nr:pyridoxal-phosphate dependent enzyme [Oceanirhabdus seepicola]MCM1991367.1 pyridoxal-phosphate dependent enzyme [Oceanirhabdus seepicola]